jgi:hypothetical protein
MGHTVVCYTDNTATEGMLKNMWGTSTFIPLLKEILVLLVKYDISLAPQRITTKDNILSDCLSRGAPDEEFQEALRVWSKVRSGGLVSHFTPELGVSQDCTSHSAK